MNPQQHQEKVKSQILGSYSNTNDLEKSDHKQHKYLRKEGEKYIYEEKHEKSFGNIKDDINFEEQNKKGMQKLIDQIQKEIEKASKEFHKAAATLDRIREIPVKEMTEKDKVAFNKAGSDYEKLDKILSVLYSTQKQLQSIENL